MSFNSNLTRVSSFNSYSTWNHTQVLSFTPKLELNSTQNVKFKTCIGLQDLLHCSSANGSGSGLKGPGFDSH